MKVIHNILKIVIFVLFFVASNTQTMGRSSYFASSSSSDSSSSASSTSMPSRLSSDPQQHFFPQNIESSGMQHLSPIQRLQQSIQAIHSVSELKTQFIQQKQQIESSLLACFLNPTIQNIQKLSECKFELNDQVLNQQLNEMLNQVILCMENLSLEQNANQKQAFAEVIAQWIQNTSPDHDTYIKELQKFAQMGLKELDTILQQEQKPKWRIVEWFKSKPSHTQPSHAQRINFHHPDLKNCIEYCQRGHLDKAMNLVSFYRRKLAKLKQCMCSSSHQKEILETELLLRAMEKMAFDPISADLTQVRNFALKGEFSKAQAIVDRLKQKAQSEFEINPSSIQTTIKEGGIPKFFDFSTPAKQNVQYAEQVFQQAHSEQLEKVGRVEQQSSSSSDTKQEAPIDQAIDQKSSLFATTMQDSKNTSLLLEKEFGIAQERYLNFTGTQQQQENHTLISQAIDRHAQRFVQANTLEEQCVRAVALGASVTAFRCNEAGKFNEFEAAFQAQKTDSVIRAEAIDCAVKIVSRFEQNIHHPLDLIKEKVALVADIGFGLADITVCQPFRTPDQQIQHLSEFLNNSIENFKHVKGLSYEAWKDITTKGLADGICIVGSVAMIKSLVVRLPQAIPAILTALENIPAQLDALSQEARNTLQSIREAIAQVSETISGSGGSAAVTSGGVASVAIPVTQEAAEVLAQAVAKVAEGIAQATSQGPSDQHHFMSQNDQDTKSGVQWTPHGFKHSPPKNVSWKKVVKSTTHGEAKYKPEVNIKELELRAWKCGQKTTRGKNWKVFKYDEIIGAKSGKETCFMRVEYSANTIHGHPILESEYWDLLK